MSNDADFDKGEPMGSMAPLPETPRRSTPARVRTRPKSVGGALNQKSALGNYSEPPPKKRRYIPGGPGGGGRYVDEDGNEIPVGGTGPGGYNYIGPRGRIGPQNLAAGVVPPVYSRQRRDRSQRTTPRTVQPRIAPPIMRFPSAAHAAAAVQSDSYKPREERAWEEFHPDLDIDAPLRCFTANQVDGIPETRPVTPAAPQSADGSANGLPTPNGVEGSNPKSDGILTPSGSVNGALSVLSIPGTPGGGKRRPGRPPKNPQEFYARKAAEAGKTLSITTTPQIPKIIAPISNINAKEKLTLPQPSYRKSDTLDRFEDKSLGLVRYVDKSMAKVGYQESDNFDRPEFTYIKGADVNLEEDLDLGPGVKTEGDGITALGSSSVGRVEYDMDEQDDKWLESYNDERKLAGFEPITREIFEITITKIEKEWHALEKRIPKPNPKPPQTHRPRSSSAAAVNGEGAGEEQDSKCAICDDGDCENTNAIVFCDGCDLAVHQECYGVPFIPEGQWLCRKCQLIGRGVPTCIFCPNTDGGFKQTNSSKWAHLLCAMWIPEISLGNTTFMEPVQEVEKVPKSRWKLTCYLCDQRMGACIQCGNKSCYQAFHVTCARRARLFLKMKNSQGTLAIIDGSTIQKAFCDKHCPLDYAKENDVINAAKEAKKFFKREFRGRIWADSQASAVALMATHRHAFTEHQPNESQLTGDKASLALTLGENKKRSNLPQKLIWKLPSGAPVIPKAVFETVEKSLQRFTIHKRKEYTANACQYWTLKREARRGAALLKRLQLQMETFSSMEITRRNFAGMGPTGRLKLDRRVDFAKLLVEHLTMIKSISADTVKREATKLEMVRLEEDATDTAYFPIAKQLPAIMDKALGSSKHVFTAPLLKLQAKVKARYYVEASTFSHDFCDIFRSVIESEFSSSKEGSTSEKSASAKKTKAHAKRILKSVQPLLEKAIRDEAEACGKATDVQQKELEQFMNMDLKLDSFTANDSSTLKTESNEDVEMTNAYGAQGMSGVPQSNDKTDADAAIGTDVEMHDIDAPAELEDDGIIVALPATSVDPEETVTTATCENGVSEKAKPNNQTEAPTPPDTNGYASPQDEEQIPGMQPPTTPISNGHDHSDALTRGGPMYYLKKFEPEGTTFVQAEDSASGLTEEMSDIEEDVDASEVIPTAVTVSPSKVKKGKAKKKARGKR